MFAKLTLKRNYTKLIKFIHSFSIVVYELIRKIQIFIFFFPICVKPRKNSIFLKNGKTVISVGNRKFSRSRITKRTSPLNSSHEIQLLIEFRRILRQSEFHIFRGTSVG